MTKRLVLTPAVGLFAGLSVVSYGAVSMMLTGVHGTRQASSNTCASSSPASPTPSATTKALTRPAALTGARAQRPAGMPVLLAYAAHLGKHNGTPALAGQGSVEAQGNQAAGTTSVSQTQTASQSSAPLPSSQPSPSVAPPLPQPSPGSSAGPEPGGLPQPAPAKSSAKPLTPGGTLKSPIATPTGTPTPTPTPTTTPTTSPPPGTLCLKMQTLDGVSAVDPHTKVRYAIFVWLTSGSGNVKVTLSTKPNSLSPAFSVCAASGTSKCTASLNAGQQVELQAKLAAPDRPTKRFILTATATSSQASNSATASATVDIKPKNPSPSSSPTPNAGDGGTLPPAGGLPSGTTIPGLGIQPTGDLGSAFPQVSPSPSASAAASQHAHETKTIDLSAGLPLDVRLIGGQVIGLAVLAAAVTIAVARLSLRRQPAKHGEDSSGS